MSTLIYIMNSLLHFHWKEPNQNIYITLKNQIKVYSHINCNIVDNKTLEKKLMTKNKS